VKDVWHQVWVKELAGGGKAIGIFNITNSLDDSKITRVVFVLHSEIRVFLTKQLKRNNLKNCFWLKTSV
jgi:hypothetical protein